jgi:hypothetical protein
VLHSAIRVKAVFGKGGEGRIRRRTRHCFTMAKSNLLRSHDELRAALLVAGKEIRKLNFGRSDTPVLKVLRRVLREARAVAKADKQ